MQKDMKCKCEYCLKFVDKADRPNVKFGEQCKPGWRWELTGKNDNTQNIGRSEFMRISEDASFRQIGDFR